MSLSTILQEVYDWVGSMEKAPLYFTLHTQGKLIKHADEVKGNSVVHVAERVLTVHIASYKLIWTNETITQMMVAQLLLLLS